MASFGKTMILGYRAKYLVKAFGNVDAVKPPHVGQYLTVLVDEGHDFAPEWLKLVTQMVDLTTNSLPNNEIGLTSRLEMNGLQRLCSPKAVK